MPFDPSVLLGQFISGLCRGMMLFVMASGLTLVFGVMRVINFAHGSFYMLAAYTAYTLTQVFHFTGYGFWIALVFAPLFTAAVGGLVEVLLLRRIYDKEHLLQILLTYGLVFVFNDAIKIFWGADMRIVPMPKGLAGSISVFGPSFPAYYFFIIAMGLFVAVALWALLHYTRLGKLMRASSERWEIVELLGYNVGAVFTAVFMIATGLAGLAGVVIAPTIRLSLGMDILIIIECFLVVIIGGLGNIWGALLAALITGQIYAFGILFVEQYAMAFLFLLAAIIIIFRPSGLLGKPVG
jgi:branched-chain amino acid transport system permease protein